MKYNAEEGFEEIKKRGKKIRQRHEQRVRRVLYGSTAILAFSVGVLGALSVTSFRMKDDGEKKE